MSDLTTFRDHARTMSTAVHRPDCKGQRRTWVNVWHADGYFTGGHYKEPNCSGCVTPADRALWARLAAEVDAYLTHDEEGLFA